MASAPLAIATEPRPEELAVAVPFCTIVTPLIDTLTFCPGAELDLPFVDEDEDDEDEDDDDDDDEEEELADAEPEFDGLAAAVHGIALSPAPMPRATASAPTRPM